MDSFLIGVIHFSMLIPITVWFFKNNVALHVLVLALAMFLLYQYITIEEYFQSIGMIIMILLSLAQIVLWYRDAVLLQHMNNYKHYIHNP